jgi:hypothetical protein
MNIGRWSAARGSHLCTRAGNLWSPWFRIIATKFLANWWSDLPQALTHKGRFFDPNNIHRFDCAEEMLGGQRLLDLACRLLTCLFQRAKAAILTLRVLQARVQQAPG